MKWIWKLLSLGIASYAAFCALVYFMQPGMIFYPDIPGRELVTSPKYTGLDYEDVEFITKDNIKLHGWFIPANKEFDSHQQATVLFFHGNAGNISHRMDSIRLFHKMKLNIFIFDYRGYGQSEGTITEQGSYLDAEAAWHYLTSIRAIKENTIIVFGRSLGGAIGTWLAAQHTPAALIIESSFSSALSMGQRFYPYLPLRLLSRYSYDTQEYVKAIHCPVLVAHSPDDDIIPYEEGVAIFKAAPEPKQFLEMRGGHNDGFILSGSSYADALESFINSHIDQKNLNTP
ncbi:MAG: alpha/beta hydrolase [Gammaproteobacteria bacterium]|nr:alpha/beta hydrolase [Gammaproteobacteria bacterium]